MQLQPSEARAGMRRVEAKGTPFSGREACVGCQQGPEGEGCVGRLSDQSARPVKSARLGTGTRVKAQLPTPESDSGRAGRPPQGLFPSSEKGLVTPVRLAPWCSAARLVGSDLLSLSS